MKKNFNKNINMNKATVKIVLGIFVLAFIAIVTYAFMATNLAFSEAIDNSNMANAALLNAVTASRAGQNWPTKTVGFLGKMSSGNNAAALFMTKNGREIQCATKVLLGKSGYYSSNAYENIRIFNCQESGSSLECASANGGAAITVRRSDTLASMAKKVCGPANAVYNTWPLSYKPAYMVKMVSGANACALYAQSKGGMFISCAQENSATGAISSIKDYDCPASGVNQICAAANSAEKITISRADSSYAKCALVCGKLQKATGYKIP